LRQLRFTQRITVSKQEEQVRHIFGINKASPSNGEQRESQSQECKGQHDREVATGFSGKICGSIHHFLRFSARENETDGFASGGLKTADAPGMCELFHTPEKLFAKSTGTEARPESVAGPSEIGTPGSGQPACTDSPRGTAELRNWLQEPLATRGSPLDHFDIALARAVGQGLEAGVGAV
jgi:hypothetical protein